MALQNTLVAGIIMWLLILPYFFNRYSILIYWHQAVANTSLIYTEYNIIFILFLYLKRRDEREERGKWTRLKRRRTPNYGSQLKCPQQPRLAQARAKSGKFYLVLQCGCQEPAYLSHRLLLPIYKKLD